MPVIEAEEPETKTTRKGDITKEAVADDDNEDLSVEFGDENLMAKGDGLDKIFPVEKDRVERAALLTDVVKPLSAWSHFVTGKGSYRCLTQRDAKGNPTGELGICCRKLNKDKKQAASLIIASLALRYTNVDPKTGKYKKDTKTGQAAPIEYEIGWLKLSRSGFRKVTLLIKEDGAATDFDLGIAQKESGIGFEYAIIADSARFRQNPELVKEVLEEAAKYADKKQLSSKLGKKITELEWKALLAGAAATADTAADVDNMDDL
jgi:hypothetical protein